MKVIILTDPRRVEKYKKYCSIPDDLEMIYIDRSISDKEILLKAKDADFIFADAIKEISGYLIENIPNLKLIHSEGVGYNRIDVESAKKANVYVCNNPGVNSGAVAEQAIMLMLGVLRSLIDGDEKVRTGYQIQAKEHFILQGITELADCHVGLIGFGEIAKETAKRLSAFGCKVSYNSRSKRTDDIENKFNIDYMEIDDLIKKCDIVSLHVPVTSNTTNMVNKKFLDNMKQNAILINTARGEIVDQIALKNALMENKIAGAGLDTLTPEPVTLDNPLLNLPEQYKNKLLFSPHIGGTTEGAFRRMHQGVWGNISKVMNGDKPNNIVY